MELESFLRMSTIYCTAGCIHVESIVIARILHFRCYVVLYITIIAACLQLLFLFRDCKRQERSMRFSA